MHASENLESNIQYYSRQFPVSFSRAKGSFLYDDGGREYIDLLCAAGSLNYGHNHPRIKSAVLDYLEQDGIANSLDMQTSSKSRFIYDFDQTILSPRDMHYRLMFCGPTGTNAVELAFKVARLATGRQSVAAFTNGFHGMSLGSLAATASKYKRNGAGVSLNNVDRYPYHGYLKDNFDTLSLIRQLLDDDSSGFEPPAAFVVETVQGEGGLNTASVEWLEGLSALAKEIGSLLIIDDIQAGCGRTGAFFSFEHTNVEPDLICLSKSLSGYGFPMSLVLVRPEIDVLGPGQHNGTFRGFNLGFVGATSALSFWRDQDFEQHLQSLIAALDNRLVEVSQRFSSQVISIKGRGLMRGLALPPGIAKEVSRECFRSGVIVETSGANDDVLKFLPALNIDFDVLSQAMDVVEASIEATT